MVYTFATPYTASIIHCICVLFVCGTGLFRKVEAVGEQDGMGLRVGFDLDSCCSLGNPVLVQRVILCVFVQSSTCSKILMFFWNSHYFPINVWAFGSRLTEAEVDALLTPNLFHVLSGVQSFPIRSWQWIRSVGSLV